MRTRTDRCLNMRYYASCANNNLSGLLFISFPSPSPSPSPPPIYLSLVLEELFANFE